MRDLDGAAAVDRVGGRPVTGPGDGEGDGPVGGLGPDAGGGVRGARSILPLVVRALIRSPPMPLPSMRPLVVRVGTVPVPVQLDPAGARAHLDLSDPGRADGTAGDLTADRETGGDVGGVLDGAAGAAAAEDQDAALDPVGGALGPLALEGDCAAQPVGAVLDAADRDAAGAVVEAHRGDRAGEGAVVLVVPALLDTAGGERGGDEGEAGRGEEPEAVG